MTVTETTTPAAAAEADKALKTKHAAMWASGDYSRVADEIVGSLGGLLVAAAGVRAGDKVVDVAAGIGTSALPAARRGATVTATDLSPELLAIGRQKAEAEGLTGSSRPSTPPCGRAATTPGWPTRSSDPWAVCS